jgi:hypothetical protein
MSSTTPRRALVCLLLLSGASLGLIPAAGESVRDGRLSPLDAEIQLLRYQRLDLAKASYDRLVKDFDGWRGGDRVIAAVQRLVEAELALVDEPTQQVAVLERQLGRLYSLKAREEFWYEMGRVPIPVYESAYDYLLRDTLVRHRDARERLYMH